jgi:hypothetical protein
MLWLKLLFRLLMMLITPVILLIPTIYATVKQLDRLPWGLDPIFGCREDGWNGSGCDPDFPRKFWRNVDRKTYQGWYPDHLFIMWEELSLFDQWWHGFWWCAFRNVLWNMRLNDWFGTSTHFLDIKVLTFQRNAQTGEVCVIWLGKDGVKRYHKRIKFLGRLLEYGYEFPLDLFDENHPWFTRVRKEGYTFDVTPFKDRSMPSLRPRKYKNV